MDLICQVFKSVCLIFPGSSDEFCKSESGNSSCYPNWNPPQVVQRVESRITYPDIQQIQGLTLLSHTSLCPASCVSPLVFHLVANTCRAVEQMPGFPFLHSSSVSAASIHSQGAKLSLSSLIDLQLFLRETLSLIIQAVNRAVILP